MGTMENKTDQTPVTVEALLKLKRNERPEEGFWEEFESTFQRRRLRELVGRERLRERIWIPVVKGFAVAVPLLALAGLLTYEKLEPLGSERAVASANGSPAVVSGGVEESGVGPEADLAEANSGGVEFPRGTLQRQSMRFVLDALSGAAVSQRNFEKVLYSPALQTQPASGQRYVEDSFSSGGYEVTTANLKLGQNF